MWNEVKQRQLNELHQQEQASTLTVQERQTFEQLLHELEQAEWDVLRPALARLRQEQNQLQQEAAQLHLQNAILAVLAERQEDLLRRAKVQLAGLLNEHEALKVEYERITGQPLIGSSF
ncbi:MAG: hypothetical protein HYR94_01545 [Chloroflexi bacterium]|nr:hypothetical protein [Chloroflexota bacterium]